MRLFFSFAALLLALCSFEARALAVTLAEGRVRAGGDALLFGFQPGGGEIDRAWVGTPTDLSADFTAVSRGLTGGVLANSLVNATWDSAGLSGSITTRHIWQFTTSSSGSTASASFRRPSWVYNFTPDVDTLFSLSFDITADQQTSNLRGYRFVVNGDDNSLTDPNDLPGAAGSGVVSVFLAGGVSHSLELYTNSSINAFAPRGFAGIQRGEFGFSMTQAVPEPGTGALVALGLGALAAFRGRSARRHAAAPSTSSKGFLPCH